MSDIIRLLPDSVANQIAAGEVIQRPASVIKELVENAIDAGASEIRIYIKDAGRTLVQVIDNGKGMSEMDARMAFERHATSKIENADDLFALHTMGFRGEALPSICAISQVEMQTKQRNSPIGTRIVINGSKVESQEPCVCADGTNIKVKNIFFNVPVRRKFLKSDSVEQGHILREFERLALVNHNIRMSIDVGNKVIDLRPGSFRQRIDDIWKNTFKNRLLPVEVDTSLVRISGFVSTPDMPRSRTPLQFFIVNGRNMEHPYFRSAVLSVFEPLMKTDQKPSFFLRFEVDPRTIDVNIHPTKSQIEFEYKQQIWPILVAAVKSALSKSSILPSIDFKSDPIQLDPLKEGDMPEEPKLDIPKDYNPFERYSKRTGVHIPTGVKVESQRKGKLGNWAELYSNFMNDVKTEIESGENHRDEVLPELVEDREKTAHCMQVGRKYILFPDEKGLVIMDQYRAHVRILYERYMANVSSSNLTAQHVMFPEVITLDERQMTALEEVKGDLLTMGFMLSKAEENNWRITAIPTLFGNSDPKEVIVRIIDSVIHEDDSYGMNEAPVEPVNMIEKIAILMARSSAVRRGTELSDKEMCAMAEELFSFPDPEYTPYGKRIYRIISDDLIGSIINSGLE